MELDMYRCFMLPDPMSDDCICNSDHAILGLETGPYTLTLRQSKISPALCQGCRKHKMYNEQGGP